MKYTLHAYLSSRKGASKVAREIEQRREMRTHTVTIEGRRRAVITGVEELDSFNEQQIVVFTPSGVLSLEGEDMHIDRLNLDEGQLLVTGDLYGLSYSDEMEQGGGGFLSRFWSR